jgi:UDP-N-acetylglucosamine acyltransferase
MNILKYLKNIKIGKNNYIEKNVKIHENVIIGNNNKIYDGTVLYPNTIIGNNNIILNNNIIGEHPIDSKEIFKHKIHNGLIIGNNNYFHINNIIYSGFKNKTIINNNNRILGECHIGHDCIINNHVNIYPRSLLCGFVKLLDYSGIGVGGYVHQKKIIGSFSFIGMNNSIVKDSLPFFININNRYTKINYNRLLEYDDYKLIKNYENILLEIKDKYLKNELNIEYYKEKIPNNIYEIFNNYLSNK